MTLAAGTLVGAQFRVERLLAEGGFGAVYVASQLGTGKLRALKLLHASVANDPRARARFEEEALVASRIPSDHVVEVIMAGIDEPTGSPFLAMELLEGETLAARIERLGALSVDETLELVRQTCHALALAHRAGVVHRDLKPENLFVARPRRDGTPFTVKILDFGIARFLDETKSATANSQVIGSPMWMAPEQLSQGAPISPRTDVWALGLIVFQCLSGRSYWRAANQPQVSVMALLTEIASEGLEPASQRSRSLGGRAIDPSLDPLFARSIDRDGAARAADAAAFLATFAACVGAAPSAGVGLDATLAVPPTRPQPSAPPAPAPRSLWPWLLGAGGLGLALVTCLAGAAIVLVQPWSSPPPPSTRVAPSDPPPSTTLPSPPPPPSSAPTVELAPAASGAASWITANGYQACARVAGTVRCWGNGAFPVDGRLVGSAAVPQHASELDGLAGVVLGGYSGCGIDGDEHLRCWGLRVHTDVGDSDGGGLAVVDGLEHVVSAALGVRHACALTRSGRVFCLGDNDDASLGDGTHTSHTQPTAVVRFDGGRELEGVTQIDASGLFTCALDGAGTVWCWGSSTFGEIGAPDDSPVALPMHDLAPVVEIATGSLFVCARHADGGVSCWGGNVRGQLGTGDTRNRARPSRVAGLSDARALAVGGSNVCVVHEDRGVSCWGLNLDGAMVGPGPESVTRPTRVPGIAGVDALACGTDFCCALVGTEVRCWGSNAAHQLGDGTTTSRATPAPPRF